MIFLYALTMNALTLSMIGVQSDLGPNCMPTPFLVEQNCLCNSGRGHHEEHFCEII